MKVLIYSSKDFEHQHLVTANKNIHQVTFTEKALCQDTALLATGYEAISVFAGDDASAPVIERLHEAGVKYIAIRAAGYDNVDLKAAEIAGIKCANVPEYSPYSVAEHAVALMLALNRKLILANTQVHKYDFTVSKLIGFDMHGKTIGVIGTGKIGAVVCKILHGFGCNLLAYDVRENRELVEQYNVKYTAPETLFAMADIITIHTPLNEYTRHLVNNNLIKAAKPGVMLINTARGAVIDTQSVMDNLESGLIGALGLDVYENEKGIFFFDHSESQLKDDLLKRLLAHPNVIITPHQAFATHEALTNIADTTFYNINFWTAKKRSKNELY